jgi:hypothetical protein
MAPLVDELLFLILTGCDGCTPDAEHQRQQYQHK